MLFGTMFGFLKGEELLISEVLRKNDCGIRLDQVVTKVVHDFTPFLLHTVHVELL
jgi:hypothetical protein